MCRRALRQLRVPPLVLQPLVENAVKHGIAHRLEGGEVTIRAAVDRGSPRAHRLVHQSQDTGVGATDATLVRGRQEGVGLRNLERRLECQYGADASLLDTHESRRGHDRRAAPAASTVHRTSRRADRVAV